MSEASNNALLSVAIPTFNRASLLRRQLDRILPAAARGGVEVLVVDNGSTDSTAYVLDEFRQRFPETLRVVRQATNVGIDANIDTAIRDSCGSFVWVCTDDDEIDEDSLTYVRERIDSGLACLIVNRSEWDATLTRCLRDRTLDLFTDTTFVDARKAFDAVARYVTFVGALVVRRDLWSRQNTKDFYGTDFGHVSTLGRILVSEAGTRIIARPLIRCRTGVATWTDRTYEVWFRNWQETVDRLPIELRPVSQRLKQEAVRDFAVTLLSARGSRLYSLSEFKLRVRPYADPFSIAAFFGLAASVCPVWIASMLTGIQRTIRRRRSAR